MDFIPENPVLSYHEDSLDVVRKSVNMDKDKLTQSIDIIEEWVMKQSHFRRKDMGRDFYERTILTCKGSVEKAKQQIDRICTFKTMMPKYFMFDGLKEKMPRLQEPVVLIPLPKITEDYRRIYLLKVHSTHFTSEDFIDYLRVAIMIAEYLRVNDYINGYHVLVDLADADIVEIIKKVNFIELQQLVTILIEGYGARVKSIHLVNHSKLIDVLAKAVKSILTPKIAGRLHVHQNLDEVSKKLDRKLLPLEMGGSQCSLKQLKEKWATELFTEKNLKHLQKMVEACTDESARQVDKFNDEYMGMPGSFKTLTVD